MVDDRFLSPGYGQLNEPTGRAIAMGARTEALMLDPVYSGKCMAGAIDLAERLGPSRRIVFLHTGGTPGIFAYGDTLDAFLDADAAGPLQARD